MNPINRRYASAAIAGAFASFLGGKEAKAQFTEQEVRNGADIVATGDVNLSQSASGTQTVLVDGVPVDDGIYRTDTGQVVVNEGQVVATGDVNVSQSASASQTVVSYPTSEGQPAERCQPGAVMANPNTGQLFYQRDDCCWYPACAANCPRKGCEGNSCG